MDEKLIAFVGDISWGEFDDLAGELGLEWVNRIPEAPQQLYEEIYETPDERTEIRYIQDHYLDVSYATFTGPDAGKFSKVVCSRLNATSEEDLRRLVASSGASEGVAYAVRVLGAFSTGIVDEAVVSWFLRLSTSPDEDVRAAVIVALGRASWPELWPVIDAGLAAESSDDLRARWVTLQEAYADLIPRPV